MKKIFLLTIFFILALGLSACTNKQSTIEPVDNVLSTETSGLNNNGLLNPINSETSPSNQTSTMKTLPNQIDLIQEYSQAVLKTNLGDITVKFYTAESPVTVNNFMNLAQAGYYNNTKFHRVIKDFMIQGGDPNSRGDDLNTYGTGGPEYRFGDEINNKALVAGSLAMANAGPNTNGSQFFIVTAAATPWLDGMHTNFGEVVAGLDVVKAIENVSTGPRDIPVEPVIITAVELIP